MSVDHPLLLDGWETLFVAVAPHVDPWPGIFHFRGTWPRIDSDTSGTVLVAIFAIVEAVLGTGRIGR